MTENHLKVRLRFKRTGDLPVGEWMWAEAIDAHDGGGLYRLLNTSFMVPLTVGDLVRACIDGRGALQVIDVVEPSERVMTVVEFDGSLPSAEVCRIADSWTEGTDGWSEGGFGVLATVWGEGVGLEHVEWVLRNSIGDRPAWTWHSVALPEDRARVHQEDIDFRLDSEQPEMFETGYWAPEDRAWAELGVTDASTLAFIQRLAGEDPRIVRTIGNGKHVNVLRYIELLTGEDYGAPLLGEPLLDEP